MIVIIGAGIAGLSLGYELIRRGAKVTIVEKSYIASGASGVATCYLEPRLGDAPMRRLERLALEQWPGLAGDLEAATGLETGFRGNGQICVALPQHVTKLESSTSQREAEGSPVERISVDEARVLEPLISEEIEAAVLLPHICWVNGKKTCKAFAQAILNNGGTVLEGAGVLAITPSGVELSDGAHIDAGSIVLCNGMGANAVQGCPEDIPLTRPVRGVNLVLDMSGLSRPVTRMIKHYRGNMVPADERRLIVGTTYEAGVEDLEVDDSVIEKLYSNAEPILPVIRELPLIDVNAGLRTKVADGILRLGRSRENPAIFYSLGHAGSGYLRAPVVAVEFAGFILDGEPGEMTRQFVTYGPGQTR